MQRFPSLVLFSLLEFSQLPQFLNSFHDSSSFTSNMTSMLVTTSSDDLIEFGTWPAPTRRSGGGFREGGVGVAAFSCSK